MHGDEVRREACCAGWLLPHSSVLGCGSLHRLIHLLHLQPVAGERGEAGVGCGIATTWVSEYLLSELQ